jgi:hypothetical protein
MNIEWLEPWRPIEDPDLGKVYEDELARELAANHQLAGLPLKAIGQHTRVDDFLFRVDDGSGRLALARLTWAGKRETPPFPKSMIFASVQDWIDHGMRPDHDETMTGE